MGCSNSKENPKRFALTDIQRRAVQENAQTTLMTNACFRVSASNCASRYRGNRTAENIIADRTPMADYFGNAPIPVELGSGEKSVAEYYERIRKDSFIKMSAALGPQIEKKFPKIRTDVELQKEARQVIFAENEAAVACVAMQLVEACIANACSPPSPAKVTPQASTAVHQVPDSPPARELSQPTRQTEEYRNDTLQIRVQQVPRGEISTKLSSRGPRPPSPPEEEDFVLPKGEWTRCAAENGMPYFYSAEENLYFHPTTGQFYDPTTEMWYDPDRDEWYRE